MTEHVVTNAKDGGKPQYPPYWDQDKDGPLLAAPFIRFSQGQTKQFGPKPVCVVEVDGEERSLWLTQTVLFQRFRDELLRRKDRKLVPGERISVEQNGKKTSESGREYVAFTIVFHDAPAVTEETLFDFDSDEKKVEAAGDDSVAPGPAEPRGDDIPFMPV